MVNSNILEEVPEEDFVKYYLFYNDNGSNQAEQETVFLEIFEKCNELVKVYTQGYIWHKDEFNLQIRSPRTAQLEFNSSDKDCVLPTHLYGIVHFGENIEDEWFIIHILLKLTSEISGLIGRVFDADGEFLLIESAEWLPDWMNPETAENRVFLHSGKILIITPENVGTDVSRLNINDALSILEKDTVKFEANSNIQNSILKRIEDYPDKIKDNLHTARVYVPVGVAAILKIYPSIISSVVHAYCNRDIMDMKTCQAMKYFPPEQRVYVNVKFSKFLYAMLYNSKFSSDRRTGWNLPNPNDSKYRSHCLGAKLACGFEILLSQAKSPLNNLESDKSWQVYMDSLKKKNYFDGYLENSIPYNDLLSKAKEYYISHRDSMQSSSYMGQKISNLMKNLEFDIDEFKNEENNLPEEDIDSWLNVTPDELDTYLEERYGQKKKISFNNNSEASSFTEKITTFLNHVSDIDGAEFPNGSVEPTTNKKKENDIYEFKASSSRVDFDPDSFSCAVQNILSFAIPEDDNWNLESDSEMSDYEDDDFIKNNCHTHSKNEMDTYMDQMDKELASTTIGESFIKKGENNLDEIESFPPVDIQVNTFKNILESYKSQLGAAGPTSNMLGSMGIHLDVNKD